MKRNLMASAVAVAFGILLFAPAAEALTKAPVWKCRATSNWVSVNGGPRVEATVANGLPGRLDRPGTENAQCANAETGAGNLLQPLGIPGQSLAASTASAITNISPELGRAIDQRVGAIGQVEGLTLGDLLALGVATATATGTCTPGSIVPVLSGTSNGATLLGGNLDGLLSALAALLSGVLGPDTVTVNEQVRNGNSLTQRALHIKLLGAGGTPVLEIVLGEAKVGFDGPVCDPDQQGDFPPVRPCPVGSEYIPSRNLCIIRQTSNETRFGVCVTKYGEIIVGPPFAGPSGGIVLPIDCARRELGDKVCLRGNADPKFAIIGTNRADRITGTNRADRILSLGGKDNVGGGRGNDCMQGGTAGDSLSGGLGRDRVYGESGGDHLNGGPATDLLSAGTGHDTINAAFGRDRALGGSGRDFINIATAGPPASANCGSGRDKVRFNLNERNRVRNCEVRYNFNDRFRR